VTGRWVPLNALASDQKLTAGQKIHLAALAIEWLAAAQALVTIHGQRRAAQRLVELDCPVRFDGDKPAIWSAP
jgi:hypothetical protein